ncbi:MAG: hypothetical protein IJW60_03480 [Clostridia bacterium]|nr:hypothetical protein [Clostridia bacterium]
MLILYILLIAYIVAINFYAFMLVKTFSEKERENEVKRQAEPLASASDPSTPLPQNPPQKYLGKLCITGALGGAITIYVCMFLFKFRRCDLLLMVLMPLLGVLNVYTWILLFRSGFGFLIVR